MSPYEELLAALNEDGRANWWMNPVRARVMAKCRGHLGIYVEYLDDGSDAPWRFRASMVGRAATAAEAIGQINEYLRQPPTK